MRLLASSILAALSVLVATALPSAAQGRAGAWTSVKLEAFEAQGFDLLGKNVEILGDYDSLLPISPRTAANIVDPRMSLGRKALSDPSLMRQLRGVDPSKLPRVALDLSQTPDATFQWFLQNQCREHCEGVYFRGQVVRHRVNQMPALLLLDASRESLASATAPTPTETAAPKAGGASASAPRREDAPPSGPKPGSADARGVALLFAKGTGGLTPAEQGEIFQALGLRLAPGGKSLLDEGCQQPVDPRVEFADLDRNGTPEVFVIYGNLCMSGGTASSIVLFVKGRDGRLASNLGFPAAGWTALATGNKGFPDLQIGGMGFCDAVWRWSGTTYEHFRNQPTADGGCKEVDGTP